MLRKKVYIFFYTSIPIEVQNVCGKIMKMYNALLYFRLCFYDVCVFMYFILYFLNCFNYDFAFFRFTNIFVYFIIILFNVNLILTFTVFDTISVINFNCFSTIWHNTNVLRYIALSNYRINVFSFFSDIVSYSTRKNKNKRYTTLFLHSFLRKTRW